MPRRIAHHEAGHAVVAEIFAWGIDRIEFAHTHYKQQAGPVGEAVLITMAGPLAEELFFDGSSEQGRRQDRADARAFARQKGVEHLLPAFMNDCRSLVALCEPPIRVLAKAILERGYPLDGDSARAVLMGSWPSQEALDTWNANRSTRKR